MPSQKVMCNECGIGIRADTPENRRVIHEECYRNMFVHLASVLKREAKIVHVLSVFYRHAQEKTVPSREIMEFAFTIQAQVPLAFLDVQREEERQMALASEAFRQLKPKDAGFR